MSWMGGVSRLKVPLEVSSQGAALSLSLTVAGRQPSGDLKGWPVSWMAGIRLFPYLKDRVYANTPTTLEELKTSVERHTQEIPLQMCQIVIANFKRRLTACIRKRVHTSSMFFNTSGF